MPTITSVPRAPRKRRHAISALIALAIAALSAALAAPASADELGDLAERRPERVVDVIVQLADGTTPAEGRADIRRLDGRVTGDLHIIHGLAARMPARAAERLQRDPGVSNVSLDADVAPQWVNYKDLKTAYPFAAEAPDAWSWGSAAATGHGVGVAVVDTGIAGSLPDFRVSASDTRSRVIASAVTNPLATRAGDGYGHGTHVAGILAGNGNNRDSTDPLRGSYVGIAPEADLISVKISNGEGEATVLDAIYGLQFVVDHKSDYNIRVVNLSLESTDPQSAATDPLDAAAESAWLSGIVVVAAAGNRGSADDAVQRAPGNDPFVISVGALDDMGTRWSSDDIPATWSSRGTTQDGVQKPDVYAPGAHIVSTLAPGSAYASLCPSCIVSGEYFRAGGTSMAAPVVAGIAALVLERRPGLTPDQVKSLITRTSRSVSGGILAVDAAQAVKHAADVYQPSANQDLTPNQLIDPTTGGIDYSRSSWSRSSWSESAGDLVAGWARSSWSCDCSLTADSTVDPTRSSWSRSSWSTSWSK